MSLPPLPGVCRSIDHTADLGFTVEAPTPEDVIRTAVLALFGEMVHGEREGPLLRSTLEVQGLDFEDLLVRFLNEALFLFQEEERVIRDVDVLSLSETRVKADITSVRFDPEIHEVLLEVKAATYHQVQFRNRNGRWEARVIFDV